MFKSSSRRARGFTLIELMVVIFIIGLLVSILIPSVSKIQTAAKNTATTAEFKSLDGALINYKGEEGLGSSVPPSRSDFIDNGISKIADPEVAGAGGNPGTEITGAQLLVHALVGADLLGTPGFRDLDHNGKWSNDTHKGAHGLYERLSTTGHQGDPVQPRYGGTSGYVDDNMRNRIESLAKLQYEGVIQAGNINDDTAKQSVFTDAFGRPILYYRANEAARYMVQFDESKPGVFVQQDNSIITGSNGSVGMREGLDFGGHKNARGNYHSICKINTETELPGVPVFDPATGKNKILTDEPYLDSFARFVLDPDSKAKNLPVKKEYLLISAGKDGVYGTTDDITNWTRK